MKDIKELFWETDIRRHKQLVLENIIKSASNLIKRGLTHDDSKFSRIEKETYVEPVWKLNNTNVEYGSKEYEELTDQMGDGWRHHLQNNDHHPDFHENSKDPFAEMNLFSLIEMLCDWIAASKRKNNSPDKALEFIKFEISPQLENILRNTLKEIVGD